MKYKIKDGYSVRQIAGTWVAVSNGKNPTGASDMVILSETGVFLWNIMLEGASLEDMVKKAMDKYEIEASTAHDDIEKFLTDLKAGKLLEE